MGRAQGNARLSGLNLFFSYVFIKSLSPNPPRIGSSYLSQKSKHTNSPSPTPMEFR